MKNKIVFTLVWMFAFAAVTFLACGLVALILTHTRIVSLESLQYVDWVLKVIFFSSPLMGLFLGVRGALPGTRRARAETH